jgi:hypothetical protein
MQWLGYTYTDHNVLFWNWTNAAPVLVLPATSTIQAGLGEKCEEGPAHSLDEAAGSLKTAAACLEEAAPCLQEAAKCLAAARTHTPFTAT